MGASSPNPRYFKDGRGLRPNWRFALRWPKTYAWHVSPRWFKSLRFAVQRWRHPRPRHVGPVLMSGPITPDPHRAARQFERALPKGPKGG